MTTETVPTVVYEPGVCNIAHDEVAYRRKVGWMGAALTVALAAIMFALDAPFWSFIFLGIPALISAIGFIQAKESFCVRYAAESRYNVGEGYDSAAKVEDEQAHAADLAKAKKMNRQVAAIGIGTGIALAAIAAVAG